MVETTERSPFGSWLRQRRHLLDLTQAQLATSTGCSAVTIRKLEGGERRPSASLAQALGRSLRVPARETDAFVRFARSKSLSNDFRLPAWDPGSPTVWRDDQLPARGRDVDRPASQFGLSLSIDTVTGESPIIEQLEDGRTVFRMTVTGTASGDLEGRVHLHLCQVFAPKPADRDYSHAQPMQIAARFTIEVGPEALEGVYTGMMVPMLDQHGNGTAHVQGTGQVISTSARFADHFLHYVFVDDEVKMVEGTGTGARGTMHIRSAA